MGVWLAACWAKAVTVDLLAYVYHFACLIVSLSLAYHLLCHLFFVRSSSSSAGVRCCLNVRFCFLLALLLVLPGVSVKAGA